MKINITTEVDQNYLLVKGGFNEKLFSALQPPFPPVKLLRFDGSQKGDLVSLKLDFFLFSQIWTSEIIADNTMDGEFYFIDEGRKLPFFLGKWRHKHRIVKKEAQKSLIIDEIDFNAPNRILDFLLYPILYLQFYRRKPIYKKYFANPPNPASTAD
ncbi:MAG: hypothetical protein WD431_06770 [Cyclobacteriaceae bacterium]